MNLKDWIPYRIVRKRRLKPYADYGKRKKAHYLLSLARHVQWADELDKLCCELAPFTGDDVGEFTVSRVFITWCLWYQQAAVVLDSLRERGIEIRSIQELLTRKERRDLVKFRHVNVHVASTLVDKRFLRIIHHEGLAAKVREANNIVSHWLANEPEWSEDQLLKGGKKIR